MKTVCKLNQCNGCMACLEKCHHNAITIQDQLRYYNAVIDSEKCINCGLCTKVCPNLNGSNDIVKPRWWNQGWAEPTVRVGASSGGAASAIMNAFIKQGGYVAACLFHDGEFRFQVTNQLDMVNKFAGSKYVKSNPTGVYGQIQSLLKAEEKVLFIGLPCQVAAVRRFVQDERNLITADLICHGTPSPALLKKCLQEYGYPMENISNIRFRIKNLFNIHRDGKPIAAFHTMDFYSIAFLHSYDYTENCYSCKYATLERVSDITLGDSWGTELNQEVKNGVSLILCQTKQGKKLVDAAGLKLMPVNIENAIRHNAQLTHPSDATLRRERFFENYEKYNSFNKAVFRAAPLVTAKEKVKSIVKYFIGGGKRM